jgi:sugar/nucleoside kinase (ribokinase family)
MSTNRRFDILAMGNAIVDVISSEAPEFLSSRSIQHGCMRLIDAAEAESLYAAMSPGREIGGGSAGNTVVGARMLGARTAFVGRVAADRLGESYISDMRAAGVHFDTAPATDGRPTGRCLIVVTPDGERTMNTYLGACQELDSSDLNAELVKQSGILYLEGYLWDPPAPRAAMQAAIKVAREAGNKVAFTLSDVFCVEGHRGDFIDLLASHVDIMFGNENEVKSLYRTDNLAAAMAELANHSCITVVTRSEKGAVVIGGGQHWEVPGEAVAKVVDTTGAGDLFAGGFMAALVEGRSLPDCARVGCISAAEVISHFGARPEADLKALVASKLG